MSRSPEQGPLNLEGVERENVYYLDTLDEETREQTLKMFASISGDAVYRLMHLRETRFKVTDDKEQSK